METPPGVVGRVQGSSSVGVGSAISSPTSARAGGFKRNRSVAGLDSSPGSVEDGEGEEGAEDRRRAPGVKRACNECRQQKVSHSRLADRHACWPMQDFVEDIAHA